jgi:nicotinate-nucleotide adenylyltransferase
VQIGILGGTFDPVHNAHLAMARAALEHLKLDKVLFIPTGPTKYRNPARASAEDRLAMLRLAIQNQQGFEIDERELRPDATGYTVDTLRSLALDQPFLLMGADQYGKLDTWHAPDEIVRLARLAVFARPGFVLQKDVKVIPMPPSAISASEIRARAARGEDISPFVPPAVADYIRSRRPYR